MGSVITNLRSFISPISFMNLTELKTLSKPSIFDKAD